MTKKKVIRNGQMCTDEFFLKHALAPAAHLEN